MEAGTKGFCPFSPRNQMESPTFLLATGGCEGRGRGRAGVGHDAQRNGPLLPPWLVGKQASKGDAPARCGRRTG